MSPSEPVDVSTWDCMNCGGRLTPAQDERGAIARCTDCGFVEAV